jgi:hypothetical protein
MERMKITCILLLISGVVIGCDRFQASGQEEKSPQNTASVETIQKDSKAPDEILFRGENMTVIESGQGDLKQLHSDQGKKSCLNKADENIKKKLPTPGDNGDTKYLEFEAEQTYNSGSDKFTVKFDRGLFSRIDPRFLKKLDQFVGFTITRNLYLIKNGNSSYLLSIGSMSATSGMGHLYRDHLLVPLDLNRPAIEFESISDDPRRIGIADSGTIYYTQIDPPYFGAVKESASKSLRLTGSLFTVDNAGNKKLESKVDFDCGNLEEIFDKEK